MQERLYSRLWQMWEETDVNSQDNRDRVKITAHSQVRMQMQITKRNSVSFKGGGFLAGTGPSKPRMRSGGDASEPGLSLLCPLPTMSLSPKWRLGSRNRFSSVQSNCSVMSDSLRSHEPQYTRPPCLSPTPGVYPNLSIESVMPPNHLILCRPLLFLPSISPSIRVFSNESVLRIRWPKYWSFSFSISSSSEHQD